MMKLRGFRVQNFRSVRDSGWVAADDVTALIGVNESGKTNLLLPLWKFSPAKGGEIVPTADYPRAKFTEIRLMETKPVFIETRFEPDATLRSALATQTGHSAEQFDVIEVARDYAGQYHVAFPKVVLPRTESRSKVLQLLLAAEREITEVTALTEEVDLLPEMRRAISSASAELSAVGEEISADALKKGRGKLGAVRLDDAMATSTIVPRFKQVLASLDEVIARITVTHPQDRQELQKLVTEALPKFVYYHQYGNLDSEIYLPHVIANLKRTDLGAHEAAKARTLRVLFEFVRLKPDEIMDLGKDDIPAKGATPEQIQKVADRKRERDILLQSADADLTTRFRSWWKQGQYRFRFHADGDHFRIWVSDDVRPDFIELEGRSTGLQWFLSFYLVFLVESRDAHAGAILLLDEPGISLHPLSQRDLSAFFESLCQTNQIIYTTHSPFLVDSNHLDRVKAVYVDAAGHTAVSSDLRAGAPKDEAFRSVYPVHAALGLSASDGLLQGCQSIIVEGPSDQIYLSAIKNALIARGKINPKREMIFLPAGGVRGVRAAATTVTARDEDNPYAVLDGDLAGRQLSKALAEDLYRGVADRLLDVSAYLGLPDAEIEDLWPTEFWADIVTKSLRGPEEDFKDFCAKDKRPVVPQVEAYAKKHNLKLEKPGWKVDVARAVKSRFLRDPSLVAAGSPEETAWCALFGRLLSQQPVPAATQAATTP